MLTDEEVNRIQQEFEEKLKKIVKEFDLHVQVIAWRFDEERKMDVIFSGNCCIACAQKRLDDYIDKNNLYHEIETVH